MFLILGLTRPQLDTVSPEVTSFIEQAEQTEVTTAPESNFSSWNYSSKPNRLWCERSL